MVTFLNSVVNLNNSDPSNYNIQILAYTMASLEARRRALTPGENSWQESKPIYAAQVPEAFVAHPPFEMATSTSAPAVFSLSFVLLLGVKSEEFALTPFQVPKSYFRGAASMHSVWWHQDLPPSFQLAEMQFEEPQGYS